MLRTRAATVALVGLFLPTPLHAQAAALDPDTREVAAYQLTAPTLQKVTAAHHQLATAIKADPRFAGLARLKAEKKRLEAKETPTEAEAARLGEIEAEIDAAEDSLPNPLEGAATLGQMEANIRKEPLLAAALKSAGLAPREYGTFILALLQASMVHGLQKSGAATEIPPDLKKRLNPENVKFVAAHEAEIQGALSEVRAATGEE